MLLERKANNILTEKNERAPDRSNVYLISTSNGSRRLIKSNVVCWNLGFSLKGKYVIWYDREQNQWVTYNIVQGTTKTITKSISLPLYFENDYHILPQPYDIVGWLEHDSAVFIYDRYDIWEVDPEGRIPPVNITHKYGSKNSIQLRYMNFKKDQPIRYNDTLFLSAFSLTTKMNGFFKLLFSKNGQLEQLTMDLKTYYFPQRYGDAFLGETLPLFPIKAKDTLVYVVRPMSATEYPNLCVTFDFKKFKALTSLHPQENYNWFTSELIHWKLFGGRLAEGILYKPENFDSHKKYPIIFLLL